MIPHVIFWLAIAAVAFLTGVWYGERKTRMAFETLKITSGVAFDTLVEQNRELCTLLRNEAPDAFARYRDQHE